LPNVSDHNPSMDSGLPAVSSSLPRNAPVDWSNALIEPGPVAGSPLLKFPMSSAPPNFPKSAGATATPQGFSNVPPLENRFTNTPLVSNTSTTPDGPLYVT